MAHMADVHGGLKRVRALLDKLNQHEGGVLATDDPDDVMAVRFAFLDAARSEVNDLLSESAESKA